MVFPENGYIKKAHIIRKMQHYLNKVAINWLFFDQSGALRIEEVGLIGDNRRP
jgi:hypothetical protein